MQDPATLPAMLCAFARFSGHCMLKSRSFSICSETHVITTSSGLISHWVCLTLSDTRARVWANCSNHKNPTRRAGNTHALTCADRGPILVHSGQGAVTLWPKHTHTDTHTYTHARRVRGGVWETAFERNRNRKWRNVKKSGWGDQKTDAQTERTEDWAPEWIDRSTELQGKLPLKKKKTCWLSTALTLKMFWDDSISC